MDIHDIGNCCNCDNPANAENILMLPYRAPESGKGWGCFVCKLPPDGAIAVLCDTCFDQLEDGFDGIKSVCVGYPRDNRRLPIDQFEKIPFNHNRRLHGWKDHD